MSVTLNFFTKPLNTEMQSKTLAFHVSRGFCWYVTSPPGRIRSSLQLRMVLGLMPKLPGYKLASEAVELQAGLPNQILALAARHWQGTLADFNTHWINLELKQLMPFEQVHAVRLATEFLNRAQFISCRHERCKAMQLSDKIPPDVMHRLQSSLASLESSLLEKDSMMPQHLRNTHAVLIAYPETTHLLDDKEIALIIDAAEVHTKTEIVKAAAAGKGASRKKVSAEDL